MDDESKKKIEGMEISGTDGDVQLSIKGDLNIDDIKEAVSKSALIKE